MIGHVVLAFASGTVIETLYALGVIFINERRALVSAWLSFFWGVAFLVGVNESFKSYWAAAAWCIGLGAGTLLGVWLKRKKPEEGVSDEDAIQLVRALRRVAQGRGMTVVELLGDVTSEAEASRAATLR